MWRGFSEQLQTPRDLLRKMTSDYERMLAAPGDPFPAFDFFVAAEHIVDWTWPDDRAKQRDVRAHDPARTVSHLASGAKHFEASDARHASVQDVESVRDFGNAIPGRAVLGEMRLGSVGEPALVITLADGHRVAAKVLAADVLAYWREALGVPPTPLVE